MKRLFLTVVALLALNGALAQQTFPDIPAGHWAGDAVSRIADLGIVTGFPDGTFRGNESFTRYQAALVISRLLDVINEQMMSSGSMMSDEDMAAMQGAMTELSSELDALGARVTALEGMQGDVDALRAQVEALTAELDTLRAQVEAGGLEGPAGPAGPPGPAGADGEMADMGDMDVEVPDEPEVIEPEVVDPDVVEAPDVIDAPRMAGDRGNFSVRLGALASFPSTDDVENSIYVPARFAVGLDDLLFGIGLRVGADYGRFTGALGDDGANSLAIAGHLTYDLNFGRRLGAYVGVGGGYELGFSSDTVTIEDPGAFAGGLVGVEYLLFGGLGLFIEGGADYYFSNDIGILPTVGGGIVYRF